MTDEKKLLKKDSWETNEIYSLLSNDEGMYLEARKRALKWGAKAVKRYVYWKTDILEDMQKELPKGQRVLRRQIDWEEITSCLKNEGESQ